MESKKSISKSAKVASLATIKNRIKKALENQKSYHKGLDSLIETTAIAWQALYEVSNKRADNAQPILEEMSREGNLRIVPNPLYKMQIEQIELIRKLLRELRLTLATIDAGGMNDDMEDLYESINNVE